MKHLSQRVDLPFIPVGHIQFHLDVNVAVIEVITDHIDNCRRFGQLFPESNEDIDSFSGGQIECFLSVNGLMHEGGVCSNDGEG